MGSVNALVGLEQASIVGRHDTATGWGYHEEIERLSRGLGIPS